MRLNQRIRKPCNGEKVEEVGTCLTKFEERRVEGKLVHDGIQNQAGDDLRSVSFVRAKGIAYLQATDCLLAIRNRRQQRATTLGNELAFFGGRIGLSAHLILPHANLLESVVEEPRLGMVHTIEPRSIVEDVDVAGGLVNLDRGLRLLLV